MEFTCVLDIVGKETVFGGDFWWQRRIHQLLVPALEVVDKKRLGELFGGPCGPGEGSASDLEHGVEKKRTGKVKDPGFHDGRGARVKVYGRRCWSPGNVNGHLWCTDVYLWCTGL